MAIARWEAIVTYRTDNGPVDVTHELHELHDLHAFVEKGPHWDTIENINIKRIQHCESETLTVEDAKKLTIGQTTTL
jgi:hypothetical protein